jgi:ketosteroid isomerase-like protein
MKRLLTRVIMLVCFTGSTSYAQRQDNQTDISTVKDTISKVHTAISSLDISKMEPLWFHNANVMLVNPRDKRVSVGWDDVKKNWENAFSFWSHIRITQTAGPYVRVDGNVAWSTGLTNTNAKAKNGTSVNLPTFESDVLRKDSDGEWKLEAHTAWRVSQ